MTRIFLAIALLFAFAALPLRNAVRALASGRVYYRGRNVHRSQNPADFWMVVGVYVLICVAVIYILVDVIVGALSAI